MRKINRASILFLTAILLIISLFIKNNFVISSNNINPNSKNNEIQKKQVLNVFNAKVAQNYYTKTASKVKITPTPIVKRVGEQKVKKCGDNICVAFNYNSNSYMHLVIGRCGINNMINIKKIYVDKKYSCNSLNVKKRNTLLYMECTSDWIGPYGIKSLVHDDGGKPGFTGGWHDRNGNATAKTSYISAKVDGKEISDGKEYKGSVEITATNYIKAFNTIKSNNFVLKEIVTYKVSPKKINVEVVTTALEDSILSTYYGLQSQNSAWNGKVIYGNGISSVNGVKSDTGPYNGTNIVDKYTTISKNGRYKLNVKIDTGYGLGTFENLSESNPTVFTEAYGKTYFNLVNGKKVKLLKDDKIKWRGSYEFN